MTLSEFKSSLSEDAPAKGTNLFLQALWNDAKGNWDKAHIIVQDIDNDDGAWIHAYLHRKEGDESNARYWYNRARKRIPGISLREEWEEIASYFLLLP
jgi:hypothetical protein